MRTREEDCTEGRGRGGSEEERSRAEKGWRGRG